MAKNVQIVPESGSLDFQNNGTSKIKIVFGSDVLVTSTGSTTLMSIDAVSS
jgi:hypothetical protein